MQQEKGRFAPSPSGRLHAGNLLSAMLAWLDARSVGAAVLFRMEDLDPARSRPEYAEAIARDLRRCGLDWDEGWPEPGYAQSERSEIYRAVFEDLREKGLVYPCFCTRADRLAASAPHPGESGPRSCRCARMTRREREALITAGRRPAWRVRVRTEDIAFCDAHYGPYEQKAADIEDFIIRRADGVYAYQLAVTTDDRLMGVTRVVRGRDLLASTPRQIYLLRQMGGTVPVYAHGPLLTEKEHPEGKLSKRLGSCDTEHLLARMTPEALIGELAAACGLLERTEAVRPAELIAAFSWDKITRENIPAPASLAPSALEPDRTL